MAKFTVYRTSTEAIEVEADNDEDAIEIAQGAEASEFTEINYGWSADEHAPAAAVDSDEG